MLTLPDFGMNMEYTPRKRQFEVGKMTEMMGMDFHQHQSPEYLRFWSLYFQFLRISPFIVGCIAVSSFLVGSSGQVPFSSIPSQIFASQVRRNDYRQLPSPQSLRSAKPKPSERPQGCQNRAAGHALKFQFGVSQQLKRLSMNSD